MKDTSKSTARARAFAIFLAIAIVGYLLLANTAPFNLTRVLISNHKNILALGPKNRVEITNGVDKQMDNLIYFNSKMDFKFNHAKVKTAFKNSSADQQILLGYRDQPEWHYNTQVLDEPFMDNLKWSKVGKGSLLYQKIPKYKSIGDFFSKPPVNKVVGIFDYSNNNFIQPNISIPNYSSSKANTSIDVPLRGKTVMYVYLNHEPFSMSITKRDLNWYSDPDAAKISVYKDKDKVYDATIDDDGNITNNHKAGKAETVDIKNPGPGLPESGVYKIVIDATGDSLITSISTNLHKIAFEGPLYVADNHEVYGNIVSQTKPTNLFTDANHINFKSEHIQSKIAVVNNQIVKINKPNQTIEVDSKITTSNISIPRSDIIINGSGYFAFSSEQYFQPTPYKILPINSAEDIAQADYILTNYHAPKQQCEWLVSEREFNISDSVINKGKLSWVLEAPGLKENKRTVEYKSIEMTLTKKGWFKQ
jgi:hypothetical protein